MGNLNRKNILRLVSIIIAMSMIVPGVILTQQLSAEASGPTTYAWVNFDSSTQASDVMETGANIVSLRETGAYVKVTEGQRGRLSENFEINDMPERTMINLDEQGISFDSQVGYELAPEWRNAGTNERLVQFIAPTETAWNNGVQAISGKILREIGNNLVVVKMNDNQAAQVEKLDYVQWVGAYEPAFKVDKDIPATGTVKITIESYDISDVPEIISMLRGYGATDIIDTQYGVVTCYVSASAVPYVARMDTVKLVWNLNEMTTKTNVGGRIVQAHDLWVNTVSNLPQNIMGEGQVIHVQDTGLDATHRDFTSGPLGNRILAGTSTSDGDYHGTHCTGIAAGNGYDMAVYLGLDPMDRVYNEIAASNPAGRPDRMPFAGRAPECSISMEAGLGTSGWSEGFGKGARVFSNSWGPMLVDNGYDADADSYMSTNPTALVVFAAGNDGPGHNTVSGGGNGKLGLGVGAVENMRPIDFDSSDDYNQMIGFSSRGPVADGRIKPDIVEIGTAVYATLSDDSAAENAGYELYDLIDVINTDTGDSLGDYISLQGTSMACPAVAGDAILVRDYLVDILGYANTGITGEPHANLMKTLLIHGAEDMGLGYPSYDQGWGRANVRNSLCPAFPNVLQWFHSDGIGSGVWDGATDGGFDLEVIDNTVPLKVTMVHWDSSGSGELTYDLDLVVTSPTGVRYEGNAFKQGWSTPVYDAGDWGGTNTVFPTWVGGGSYDFDEANDGGDDENNIEVFRVQYPEKGVWDVDVVWKESTARPFSVAVTGGFAASSDVNAVNNAYKVNMQLDIPRVVPERDDFGEGTFKGAPDGSIIVPYWINNGGSTDDAYTLTATTPSGFTPTFYPASPVSVDAGERLHAYARIMIDGSVTPGSYTLSFKAESNGDASAPIAQSQIKFQIDVVTEKTPPTITVAGSPAHEAAPTFVSDGDTIYCAYTQDDQYGDRVYFTMSTNGGDTWTTPEVISEPSWTPGYVDICRAPSGTYAGRVMIAFNAWNPDGYGGSSSDTRCSYVKTYYCDNPDGSGDTWTLSNGFSLGEGTQGSANTYRTINVDYVTSVNQFYLTIENFGYSSTDLNSASQVSIDCIGKSSTNGGASWNAWTQIDPGVSTMFYFFPNTDIDENGNMVLFFYERDSGDAAQDRDATFKYYDGTWSSMYSVWDTTDNLMMPQTVCTDQGTNSNRAYGAYLKGANTDGDRQLYLTYTDNPDAATPTFVTNLGPLADGVIMSDHDYGTRFVFDMEYDGTYTYVFGHRNIRYDDYGQPNMLTVYDDNYLTTADTHTDYLTLDSYVHGKQRAAATIHDSTSKVFVAQNVMTNNAGHDIVGMHVYPGWQTATDTWGPITEYVSADKTICNAGDIVTVVANVHDWTTGGNNIRGAEYNTSVVPGTWVSMDSMDGAFNSPTEAVASNTLKINTAGWSTGWKTIGVRGQDSELNWGPVSYVRIYVNPQVTAVGTVNGPASPGTDPTPTLTYETEGIPTSMVFYQTNNGGATWITTPIGTDNSPMTLPQEFTTPDLGADGTYGFTAVAVGGASTEVAPINGEAPEWTYVLDRTAPADPATLTVDNWGPDTEFGSPVVETRYLRGVANEATVNGLTSYSLGDTQSATAGNWAPGANVNIYLGMRVFKRSSGGTETEITTDLSAQVSRTTTSSGFQTATWTPPAGVTLDAGDSIVMRVYGATTANPTTVRATFTTEQLGPALLDENQWTVQYWTKRAGNNQGGTDWYWGTTTYDNHITGFSTTPMVVRNPALDNTLNWTASTSGDVDHYNIYKSTTPADATYAYYATVPVGTNTYLDPLFGEADAPSKWWYYVTAVDLAGNEGTGTLHVEEEGLTGPQSAYNIPIPGTAGAGDWVFVSFPFPQSGNIATLLDDSIEGDDSTHWDIAKWYDPQDTADPWKTYSTVFSAVNDMPTFNNAMGVWLRLTDTGGDDVLTTGFTGAYSTSAVNIPLYAGWNLVGYPSANPLAGDVTLVGTGADMIGTYDSAPPYVTDTSTLSSVTFTAGNAYWVHVDADTTWTVDV